MGETDLIPLIRAAEERHLAVAKLQKKYEASANFTTQQLVEDMRELLATERIIIEATITILEKFMLGERPPDVAAPVPLAVPSEH